MRVIAEDAAQYSDGSDEARPAEASPRRIQIAYIRDRQKRGISFSKRKQGIFKKAHELGILTGTQILLLIVSETGLVYTYTTDKLQPLVASKEGQWLIQSCLSEGTSVSSASEGPLTPPMGPSDDTTSVYNGQAVPSLALAPTHEPVFDGTIAPADMLLTEATKATPPSTPRALKKRRTVDNLRAADGNASSQPAAREPVSAAQIWQRQAEDALFLARQNPVLANLMQAFQAQQQAEQEQPLRADSGVILAISQLMLSMQTSTTSDAATAGLNELDAVLADFTGRYIPAAGNDPHFAAATASLLDTTRSWIRWLFAQGWIEAARCNTLLRQIGPTAPRRIASNSRLRRTASAYKADNVEAKTSTALKAVQDYARYVQSSYPAELFDESATLSGAFAVLSTGSTFAVLDCGGAGGPAAESLPSDVIKVRLPTAATCKIRRGDRLRMTVRRLLGDPQTAHWLPESCDAHTAPPLGDSADEVPPSQQLHDEMQKAQEADDQLAFAEAYARWHKALQVENLTAQGEISDYNDGYAAAAAQLPLSVIAQVVVEPAVCEPTAMMMGADRGMMGDDDDASFWLLK